MTAPAPRPRVVTAAFWCWVVASVMLMVGGLIAASVGLPTPYRAAGVMTVVAGGAMAFLAGRVRSGDARFRRAAVALSLTIVALVALVSAFGVVHIVTLLAVFPLLAGAVLVTRQSGAKREETA
jgi:peptidoglycan/LPS O-acetylase OafA/YrhL